METLNRLDHLPEFEEILKDYQPSQENIETLRAIPLVLLVGPTASGRNTLINLLVETGRYHYIVSDTTRQPRTNNGVIEQDGVEYWFKSEEDFLTGLRNGEYLEAAPIHNQQVSGMGMDELRRARAAGKIALNEIENEGAEKVRRYKPETLFIFLLPPNFDVWMQRLRKRGTLPEDEVMRRLESAHEEIFLALQADYFHFVTNNEVHEAAQAVDELAQGRAPDVAKQQKGIEHAQLLMAEVQEYLDSQGITV